MSKIKIIIGHYGSGKTEFAVSLAMRESSLGKKVAIADLDIVNPYFRSRERADILEANGVRVISSSLGHNLTLDLPAVSAEIRGPILDKESEVILDVGGNSVGAKVLMRFKDDIIKRGYEMLFVVNGNRPETSHVDGIIRHIREIEYTTGMKVSGLINNTHLIWDTTRDELEKGEKLSKEVEKILGTPIMYTSCLGSLYEQLREDEFEGELLEVGMYMRDAWM